MLLSCKTSFDLSGNCFLKVFGTRALKCSVEVAYCPVDNENWGDAFPLGPPFDSSAFSLVSAGDAFSQTFTSILSPLLISSVLSRCSFPSERQARLEAVREAFLAAYSSTVGLKSSAPSPSGAISGLLEQFARGVGLRGSNAIVWASWWDPGPSCLHQLIQHVCAKQSPLQF